jgi:membrane associated rhomboid family serine protease
MAKAPRFAARPATAGLIALCCVVFVVCVVALVIRADEPGRALLRSMWAFEDAELLEAAGGLAATRVWIDGQWWRVLTAGLLHGSWLHLGLNMLGMWAVGQWTEKIWGPWRQLALFVVASVGGCLASLAWAEAPLVVGASAGIFGIAGALVVARAWGREELRDGARVVSARVLGFWLVFWLVVGALLPLFLGFSLLAQAGHIGGLAFGCVLGWGWSRPKEQRLGRYLSTFVVVAGILGLGFAAKAPAWRANYHVFMGSELLDRGAYEEAAEHFDVALEKEPDDADLANAVAYSLAEAGVELERAEELVVRALEEKPESADFLDTLGWVQCKQGRFEEGKASLERAREVAERDIPEIGEHLEGCESVGR